MQGRNIVVVIALIVVAIGVVNSCAYDTEKSGKDQPKKGVITPPDTTGLANVPDLPLAKIPATLSVKEVVEHRTALQGKTVVVHGFVVEAILGEKACPSGKGGDLLKPTPESCARPRIIVADTLDKSRDLKYDVMVLVSEEEEGYSDGQPVEVKGTVFSSKVAVYLEKEYTRNE